MVNVEGGCMVKEEINKEKRIESKVVFREGDEIKSLRGVIIQREEDFIVIERNDGIYEINRKDIIKIYTPIKGGDNNETP